MHQQLIALTEAVADGRDLDWTSIDLSPLDEVERARVAELRAVDGIARTLASLSVDASVDLRTRFDLLDAPLPAIETWGGLTIREHAGRGRFGDVYRAWDPAIERHVALKLLRHPSDSAPADSAVVQEARLMARVRHPNVATIYGAARHEGRTGLWMEFVEGQTLQAEVRERSTLPAGEAAAIGIELCRALAAVHAAGLVHRDVKTQNVMREVGGRVVLGDFGTGLELEADSGDAQLAGTPLYLAPELWAGTPATPQSDLYSLGVLLFHLVTGSFPVQGRSIGDIRRAHATGARRTLGEVGGHLPVAFVSVVDRALAAAPADRFADARSMEAALAAAFPDRVEEEPPAAAAITGRVSRKKRLLAMVGVLGTAAAIGAVFVATPAFDWIRSSRAGGGGRVAGSRQLNRVPVPGFQFLGRPAPDGRTFSFVALEGDLGVFDVSTGQQRILTTGKQSGGSAFESSAFSPDGRSIAYAWQGADGTRELRIVDVESGISRAIWNSRDEVAHPIDWAQGNDRLLVAFQALDGQRRLGMLPLAGSPATILTAVDSGFSTARLSPMGDLVVFDALQRPDSTARDIFVASVDRPGERTQLVAGLSDDFGPLWINDGRAILFISDRSGERSVWSVTVEGESARGEPTILHRNLGRVIPNGLSNDGALYYTLQVGLVDVYEAAFDTTREPAAGEAQPISPAQTGSRINAQWSPDGERLAYVALPHAGPGAANNRRLAILDRGASTPRLLNLPLSYYLIPRWSPDGNKILVKGADLQSRGGLFLVDLQTDPPRTIPLHYERKPDEIGASQWANDSTTVLFARRGVGLFALDVESRKERQLFDFPSEGIRGFTNAPAFKLSPDGRMLAYSANRPKSGGGNEIVLRVKTIGQPGRDLVAGPVWMEDWTADGNILFTRAEEKQVRALWSVPASGGTPVRLGAQAHGLRMVSVHPSGRRIVFTAGMPGSELWSLANFLPPNAAGR
jgi:serine/threonine-protein kinase